MMYVDDIRFEHQHELTLGEETFFVRDMIPYEEKERMA